MNSNFKNQVNFALVITVLFFLVLACDAWVDLTGKIADENGNPIGVANIVVEQGKSKVAEETSGNDGSFRTHGDLNTFPFAGRIKLTVSKEGFEIYEKVLSQEEMNSHKIDVVLKKN